MTRFDRDDSYDYDQYQDNLSDPPQPEPDMTDNIAVSVDQTRTDGCIGASEAAAALGLDPHNAPLTLYRRLRGLHVDDVKPDYVQEAANWGNALEPLVRGRYALDRGVCVAVPKASITKDGWLRATPDGLVMHPAIVPTSMKLGETLPIDEMTRKDIAVGFDGLVQVKTCSPYAWQAWGEAAPVHHEIQCRVEMAVCNLPWNDLAYLVGGQRMVIQRIEREAELECRLLSDLHAFWQRAQEGMEPPVDATAAYRELAAARMKPGKVVMTADEDTRKLLDQWKLTRALRKRYENAEESIKTELMLRMSAAGATGIDSEAGKVSAYAISGRVDWKAYAETLGGTKDGGERFRAASKSWGLRAPREWSDDDGDE